MTPEEEKAYLSVSCPLCKALSGQACTMPNGYPYYRRTPNRQKYRAYHERRKKRAFAIYSIHATGSAVERADQRSIERIEAHPRVRQVMAFADGASVIRVDFGISKKGA